MVRYNAQVFESLDFIDIFPTTIKTFFFGFSIELIGCYKGFTAAHGTESVGKAANSAVKNLVENLILLWLIYIKVQRF